MKSEKQTGHLNEDQLIRALVDEVDLPTDLRDHLTSCTVCRSANQKMEARLERLGELAREFSPSPIGKVRLANSDRRPVQSSWWRWDWRGLSAAGFGVAVLLLMLTNLLPLEKKPETRIAQLEKEMTADEQLLESVDRLEDDALPTSYVEILDEPDADFDDDFIDFVVPGGEHKSSYLKIHRKGKVC